MGPGQARWTALYAFLIYPTAPVVAALWGTTYLTDRGFDLVQATMINSMVWIGMAVGSPIIGWYSDYVQRRNPFMIFYPILGIVSLSLALFLPTQGYWTYIVLFFLMGVSTGGQTLSFAVMSEHTYKKSQSTAMGFNNSAVMLGATIIQATSGFIFNHIGKGGLSQPNTEINLHAFQMAIGVQLIFLAIAFIVSAFCIKETYGHHYLDNHKV
ncbi:MAG: MFS transporter [Gammaproteobacteria bacterium]|nr:MFS transporter [Gammaproteobacteria bacterium]